MEYKYAVIENGNEYDAWLYDIPDLWHLAMAMKEKGITGHEEVLQCWHQAHRYRKATIAAMRKAGITRLDVTEK